MRFFVFIFLQPPPKKKRKKKFVGKFVYIYQAWLTEKSVNIYQKLFRSSVFLYFIWSSEQKAEFRPSQIKYKNLLINIHINSIHTKEQSKQQWPTIGQNNTTTLQNNSWKKCNNCHSKLAKIVPSQPTLTTIMKHCMQCNQIKRKNRRAKKRREEKKRKKKQLEAT